MKILRADKRGFRFPKCVYPQEWKVAEVAEKIEQVDAAAFILNGLLAVEEEEFYRDWESTGFWNGNSGFNHRILFNKLVAGFEKGYPEGKTINDKIELYVKSLGFTDADIAKFRSIMLEE